MQPAESLPNLPWSAIGVKASNLELPIPKVGNDDIWVQSDVVASRGSACIASMIFIVSTLTVATRSSSVIISSL